MTLFSHLQSSAAAACGKFCTSKEMPPSPWHMRCGCCAAHTEQYGLTAPRCADALRCIGWTRFCEVWLRAAGARCSSRLTTPATKRLGGAVGSPELDTDRGPVCKEVPCNELCIEMLAHRLGHQP